MSSYERRCMKGVRGDMQHEEEHATRGHTNREGNAELIRK